MRLDIGQLLARPRRQDSTDKAGIRRQTSRRSAVMNTWTSYRGVRVVAALAALAALAGCSSEPSQPGARHQAELRFFDRFSGLAKNVALPGDLWRSASATVQRQVADRLDAETARFAKTALGGLWVVLGLKHACLIDRHGAVTCSPKRPAERNGMALGTILPSRAPETADYALQGVIPDSIRALRLRVNGQTRVQPLRHNTLALIADRPIVILGPVPRVAPERHSGA